MEETISEAASKKKRGRPLLFSEDEMAMARYVKPDAKSQRSLQNATYLGYALRALIDDPAYAWLCDKEKMNAGAAGAWRQGILVELGRLLHPENIKAFAARICELKPKTKDAIAMLRKARTGKAPAGNPDELAIYLARALDRYVAAHPSTTSAQILGALGVLRLIHECQEPTS